MELSFIRIFYFLLLVDRCVLVLCSTIKFKDERTSLDADESRSFILPCQLEMPNPQDYELSWLYNGVNAANKRRYVKNGDLHIKSVNKTLDDGKFQCQATLRADSDVSAINAPVQLNIKWVEVGDVQLKFPSSPDQILPGKNITLKCGIDGKPRPRKITWRFKNQLLKSNSSFVMSKLRLTLINVRLRVFDGMYNCCASHQNKVYCSSSKNTYNLHVIDKSEPKLVKEPPPIVYAAKNTFVQLDCLFTAQPSPTIKWTMADGTKALTNKPRMGQCKKRCIYENGTMTLPSFRESQESTFTCNVFQSGEKKKSISTKVTLAKIGNFEVPEKTQYLKINQNFEYVCDNVQQIPDSTVTWLKDGIPIGSRGHVSQTAGMLIIDHAEKQDAGLYTCLRRNIAGNVTFNLTLQFQVPPVVYPLDDQTVDEGRNVTWSCVVSDSNGVKWFKDGSPLEDPRLVFDGNRLRIINVAKSDEGKYFCQATNSAGSSDSNTATLSVSETLKFSPMLRDVCVESGLKTEVPCSVSGAKSPQINWKSSSKTSVKTLRNGSKVYLVFDNPTKSDAGSYQCFVTEAGKVILSKTIEVNVVNPPEISESPQDQTKYEGKSASMVCTSNQQNLQVSWRHDNMVYRQTTTERHLTVFKNGTLTIPSLTTSDDGVYTCSYQVCDFTVSASAKLNVLPEPKEAEPTDEAPASGNTTQLIQTIALSVSGGVAYVLITVALIIYFRGRHRKKRSNKPPSDEEQHMLNGLTRNGQIQGEVVAMDNGIPLSVLSRLDPDLENLHYPATNIDPVTVIGKGEFGEVFLSKAPGLFPDLEEDILVMVKSLDTKNMNSNVVDAYRCEFNQEISTLHRSMHDNVVKLLAVSGDSCLKPNYLITEYLEWGILKLCLQASKQGTIPKLTKQNKMSMCCQIACGLEHLTKKGLLHRDLAARNCVVSSQLLVKISMLGLSVEGFENEYVKHDGRMLPIRWMAPECIAGNLFSAQSDVWSFGVTCWEIFNLGKLPYDDLTDDQCVAMSMQEEPTQLPPLEGSKRFTSLISKCCQATIANRPDIKQITKKLQSITGEVPQTVQADVTHSGDDE